MHFAARMIRGPRGGHVSPGQQPKGAARGRINYAQRDQAGDARACGDTICSGDAKTRGGGPRRCRPAGRAVVYCGLFPVDSTQYQLLRERSGSASTTPPCRRATVNPHPHPHPLTLTPTPTTLTNPNPNPNLTLTPPCLPLTLP